MKKSLCILGLLGFMGLQAQTGKVGINTETPTEILDVNGTARVRNLPVEGGSIYTTGENTTATTATGTFAPKYNVVVDENGVLGKGEIATTASATTTPMFMKRRYISSDWPTGRTTTNGTRTGADTGVSSDEWDAIINFEGVYKKTVDPVNDVPLMENAGHGIRLWLEPVNGTWRVFGDIGSMKEEWMYSILFIKRDLMLETSETQISL